MTDAKICDVCSAFFSKTVVLEIAAWVSSDDGEDMQIIDADCCTKCSKKVLAAIRPFGIIAKKGKA